MYISTAPGEMKILKRNVSPKKHTITDFGKLKSLFTKGGALRLIYSDFFVRASFHMIATQSWNCAIQAFLGLMLKDIIQFMTIS